MTNDYFHRSVLLANVLISLVLFQSSPGLTQTATPSPSSPQLAAEREQLQNQKLKQEIEKLEQETVKIEKEAANLDQNFWEENSALVTTIASLANAVTAIVAIIGAFVTIGRQLTEIRREKKQQLDQRFTSIVERLGSEQSELKASATVSLLTFLEPGYEKYREQVYLIVLANLKLDNQDPTINRLLVQVFEQVIDVYLKPELTKLTETERKFQLDLSGCYINGITLANLSLTPANLSEAHLERAVLRQTQLIGATLQKANLTYSYLDNVNLDQANLKEAVFSDYQNRSKSDPKTQIINSSFNQANLISVQLKRSTVVNTTFQGARLQEIHLDGANLSGVSFERGNLNTAFFKGATLERVEFAEADLQKAKFQGAVFDDLTLESIARNPSWMKAEFDDDITQRLKDKMQKVGQS